MFKVQEKQCDQCLFSKNRIVKPGRFAEILRICARTDSHFVCHKSSIAGDGKPERAGVCCRGFYDRNPGATNLMRIAHRLNAVTFVRVGLSKRKRTRVPGE